jgi:hypothetical protein
MIFYIFEIDYFLVILFNEIKNLILYYSILLSLYKIILYMYFCENYMVNRIRCQKKNN